MSKKYVCTKESCIWRISDGAGAAVCPLHRCPHLRIREDKLPPIKWLKGRKVK